MKQKEKWALEWSRFYHKYPSLENCEQWLAGFEFAKEMARTEIPNVENSMFPDALFRAHLFQLGEQEID